MKRTKGKKEGIGIVEAVETLSSIADLDFESDVGVTREKELAVQGEAVRYQTVHWITNSAPTETLRMVKDTFRVVLHYLKGFYESEYEHLHKPETIEEIKTIMVLVGEAAQKLDRYNEVFTKASVGSVTDLKEYRKLQQFYRNRISKKIDAGFVNRWLEQLPQQADDRVSNIRLRGRKKVSSKHVYVDLDTVKRDSEYELFFIRKEDGTRYFSPRLIRNIKLVCDFGEAFGPPRGEDPLKDLDGWVDKLAYFAAKELLASIEAEMRPIFGKAQRRHKKERFCRLLQQALLALMLAANPKNLLSASPVKSCRHYFADFQVFLREALETRHYKKMLAYPPTRSSSFSWSQMRLVEVLCDTLYSKLPGLHALAPVVTGAIKKGAERLAEKGEKGGRSGLEGMAQALMESHRALDEGIKSHPKGPLDKVLELMQEYGEHTFDSLLQQNLPGHQYDLQAGDKMVACLRTPSPTNQEFIHRAKVNPEFRVFLRAAAASGKHHLLVNLQDRTSWREHLRCHVLEELGKHKDFRDQLTVVSISSDTDFYHQLQPYSKINRIQEFKAHFLELLSIPEGGYCFPTAIKKQLLNDWTEELFDTIHEVFFDSKNVLSRSARLDFIQLYHFFLILKLLEVTDADTFSLSCKDVVDTGAVGSVGLFLFLKIFEGKDLTVTDRHRMETLLFAPALTIRHRNVQADRVERVLSAISYLEGHMKDASGRRMVKKIHDRFAPLFSSSILEAVGYTVTSPE